MNEETKKAAKVVPDTRKAFARERSGFKALLLANPNYFGNLSASPFKAVQPIAGNTYYEELVCLGYHPQHERLEGVIHIYQPSGYGTGICGPGTPEFVRFYLSYDNGATWQDQGLSSFQAHDIPQGTAGARHLEFAVSHPVNPVRKFCTINPLIKARAILSWNNPPPANQPDWPPIWGNRLEVNILVEPFRLIPPIDLFDLAKVKLPKNLADLLDLQTPLPVKSKSLEAAELAVLYKDKGVPPHRFAFKELASFASGQAALSATDFAAVIPGISINENILDLLFPQTDGDTSYEELTCVGLDPNVPDTLVGIIKVKKPSGFSGGPCTQGSREYVTFWGDFNGNGTFETCLGTASVQAYDLTSIPAEGVHYAVRLPVDLSRFRRPCLEGPVLVPIRAILSWNTPVPCWNPNKIPTWGNREETLISIAPTGQGQTPGRIAILGGIPVGHIDDVTGLTTATAVFAKNNLAPDALGRPCPFGGRISVQGLPVLGHSYLVEVSQDGINWTPVLNDIVTTDGDGNTTTRSPDPVTHRFSYLDFEFNVENLLAQWDSVGDARWLVRLSVFSPGNVLQGMNTHAIQLDNTWPEASIVITTGVGNCGKFPIGTNLTGTFVARDLYFGGYSLGVEPAVNDPGEAIVLPSQGNVQTSPAPGNGWSLNTAGMIPCGYVVRVAVRDRAIVDSASVGHHRSDSAGLCLEEAAG